MVPFVKQMRGDTIDFHLSKYNWERVQKQQCFDSKSFFNEYEIQQLVKIEQSELDWAFLWVKDMKQKIVAALLKEVIAKELMSVEDF